MLIVMFLMSAVAWGDGVVKVEPRILSLEAVHQIPPSKCMHVTSPALFACACFSSAPHLVEVSIIADDEGVLAPQL